MNTEFPEGTTSYLKASEFQDAEKTLTYRGWERKANEDRVKDGKVVKSWKDCLDFCLKYSYPQYAKDKAGEPILGDDGQPLENRNWLEEYPHGYSIVYHFDEGQLESGSMPLYRAFCRVQPKVGDRLVVMRTGEKTETAWHICKESERSKSDVPEIDVDEHGADLNTPF